MAQVDAIHRAAAVDGPPTDGYGQITSQRIADLDGRRVGDVAAAKATGGADPIELEPGSYEVVLEAEAVAAMLLFPAWLGFNGKAYAEGTSFVHLGEQQFDERIDLWDDGTDPRALGRPYDAEGTPKRRVDLVADGVTVGLAHDRRSAALAGVETTGSSIGQESFGGYPGDLFLGGGDESLEQLIARRRAGPARHRLLVQPHPRPQDAGRHRASPATASSSSRAARSPARCRTSATRSRSSAPWRPATCSGIGDDAQLVSNEGGIVHVPSLRLGVVGLHGRRAGVVDSLAVEPAPASAAATTYAG